MKFVTFEVKEEDGTKIQYDVAEITKYEHGHKDDLHHCVLVRGGADPKFAKPHDETCFGRANATGILAGLSTLVWRVMGMSFRLNLLLRAVAEQSQIISLYSPT